MHSYIRFTTELGEYIIDDLLYQGRNARVLYNGDHSAAQSGIPLDGNDEMLFDYNRRFMELALGICPQKVLLIGGGSYTLPTKLLQLNADMVLHIVEPDEQMEAIAKRYFGYQPGPHTQSFVTTGAAYLAECTTSYDVIYVDAFLYDKVPAELQTVATAAHLRRVLRPNGVLAMNIIAAARGRRAAVLERQCETLATAFGTVAAYPATNGVSEWIPQNFLLCAGRERLEDFLRYPPIIA